MSPKQGSSELIQGCHKTRKVRKNYQNDKRQEKKWILKKSQAKLGNLTKIEKMSDFICLNLRNSLFYRISNGKY